MQTLKAADQTEFLSLSEQLRISEVDIVERKALVGFTAEHAQELQAARSAVADHLEVLIDHFYSKQISIPEVRTTIGDKDTLARLKLAMRDYIVTLFDGDYGLPYVNSRLRIGKVHARIGVPPKLYVSSLHFLEEVLMAHLKEMLGHQRFVTPLHKILMFDLQLVFDTYVQGLVAEAELARDEVMTYSRNLERIVAERTEDIRKMAITDELTGVQNRRGFYARCEAEIERARLNHTSLSVVFIDIDKFKQLNDTRGHLHGDKVLERIGRLIRQLVRDGDAAFRYGGDEFCILLPKSGESAANQVAARLNQMIHDAFGSDVRLSVGIASFDHDALPDVNGLISAADTQMYLRKSEGTGVEISMARAM